MVDINIPKHPKVFILACVRFWWMDEKWRHHDVMVVIVGELHSNWKGVIATKL
jgi:hypothetical protein